MQQKGNFAVKELIKLGPIGLQLLILKEFRRTVITVTAFQIIGFVVGLNYISLSLEAPAFIAGCIGALILSFPGCVVGLLMEKKPNSDNQPQLRLIKLFLVFIATGASVLGLLMWQMPPVP